MRVIVFLYFFAFCWLFTADKLHTEIAFLQIKNHSIFLSQNAAGEKIPATKLPMVTEVAFRRKYLATL